MKKGQNSFEQIYKLMLEGVFVVSEVVGTLNYIKCRCCLKKIWCLNRENGNSRKLNGHIKNCKFKSYKKKRRTQENDDKSDYSAEWFLIQKFRSIKKAKVRFKDESIKELFENLKGEAKIDKEFIKEMELNENYSKWLSFNSIGKGYQYDLIRRFDGKIIITKIDKNKH